jgi:hypothetical protein
VPSFSFNQYLNRPAAGTQRIFDNIINKLCFLGYPCVEPRCLTYKRKTNSQISSGRSRSKPSTYIKAWEVKYKNKNKDVKVSNYCSLGHSPEHVIFPAATFSLFYLHMPFANTN